MNKEEKKQVEEAERKYPGAAIDAADDNKVSEKLVDEQTSMLNDNPRNDDI